MDRRILISRKYRYSTDQDFFSHLSPVEFWRGDSVLYGPEPGRDSASVANAKEEQVTEEQERATEAAKKEAKDKLVSGLKRGPRDLADFLRCAFPDVGESQVQRTVDLLAYGWEDYREESPELLGLIAGCKRGREPNDERSERLKEEVGRCLVQQDAICGVATNRPYWNDSERIRFALAEVGAAAVSACESSPYIWSSSAPVDWKTSLRNYAAFALTRSRGDATVPLSKPVEAGEGSFEKERVMDKSGVMAEAKVEFSEASIRLAATQATKFARGLVAAAMVRQLAGDEKGENLAEARRIAAEFLQTPLGDALTRMALGFAVEAIPNEKAKVLAKELRVSAMERGGNEAVEFITKPLREFVEGLASGEKSGFAALMSGDFSSLTGARVEEIAESSGSAADELASRKTALAGGKAQTQSKP